MTADHSLPTRLCDRATLPSPGSGEVSLEQVASLLTTPMGSSAAVDATLRDSSQPPSVSGLLIETRSVGAVSATGDLPQYEPIELLGCGGMGAVVAARQNCLGRRVALKRILPELVGDERLHQQFLAEAALTAQLVHPNIPQIYEMGLDGDGTPFYTMQEITGRRWEDFLRHPVSGQEPTSCVPSDDGPTTLDDHLAIFLQVCNAIGFAHSRGIIHRDIKPANVMLGSFGQVYVMDWGLAAGLPGRVSQAADGRCIADPLSPETAMGGTPAYMAPEMARALHRDIDERSDIYLLGAVLYRILTGAPPHDGQLVKDCLHLAANNHIRPSPVTGELMAIAQRAMATRPTERFADVADLREAVQEAISHRQSNALAERARDHLDRAGSRDSDEVYRHALVLAEEAALLWPDSRLAAELLTTIHSGHAAWLLDHGEIDAAERLLRHRVASDHPVHERLQQELARRRRRQRRNRQLRLLAVCLGLSLAVASALVVSDYRKRWSSWREIAHFDFTQPDAIQEHADALASGRPTAVLYNGDLSGPLPAQPTDRTGMTLDPKNWLVIDNVALGDAARIRTVFTVGQDDAIEIGFGARIAELDRWYHGPAGYGVKIITKLGESISLYRNDQDAPINTSYSVPNDADLNGELVVELERQANTLSLSLNGRPVISRRDILPLTGFGFDGLCLRFHRPTTLLRTLTVWHRPLPERADPLVAGDSLVVGSHATDAALTYARIAKDFRDHDLEPVALLKTCLAAEQSLLQDADQPRITRLRDRARRRLAERYADTAAHTDLLIAEAHRAWQLQDVDRSLRLAEQALAQAQDPDFFHLLIASQPQALTTTQLQRIVRLAKQHELRRLVLGRCRLDELPDCQGLRLDWLDLSDNNLTSIDGLRGAQIRRLSLADNAIDDLGPLTGMRLELLNIAGNDINDIAPLTGQPLHSFDARDNVIADLAPLAGAPLRMLDLSNNPVVDLTPIATCPLNRISLIETAITDIAALAGKQLIACTLTGTAVADLEPLRGAPLLSLDAAQTPISNLGPLADCRQLTELHCSGCRISDLGPLAGLPLFRLHANSNKLTNIGPLAGGRLHALDLSNNQIDRIDALAGHPIVQLNLSFNRISDLGPLHGMPLHTASLDHNRIADLEPLAGANLRHLRLDDNQLTDLRPLADLSIEQLSVSFNDLTSLDGLQELPLKRLSCRYNPIDNLAPLSRQSLSYIDATGCRISSLQPLAGSPLLEGRFAHNRITDLAGIADCAQLDGLDLRDNRIEALDALRDTKLRLLRLSGNPIADLTALAGLSLERLECYDCSLTNLEPFVRVNEAPRHFAFGPGLPTEELQRCRAIWQSAERPDLVRRCDIALARQRGDSAALQELATIGPDGRRHLLLEHPMTRARAERLAEAMEATLFHPQDSADLAFIDRIAPTPSEVWIGRPPADLPGLEPTPATAHDDCWHLQHWVGPMALMGDPDRQRYSVLLSWPAD